MPRSFYLILTILALLLAGCSTVEEKKPFDGPLSWPQPPDQPRFAYETELRSIADVAFVPEEVSIRAKLTGTSAVSDQPVTDKPSSIVARNGKIYVADTGSNTIVVFDVPSRKVYRFGIREPGNLKEPAGLAMDEKMNIYVADSVRRTVFVYDGFGLFLRMIGGPEDLERPTGVAVTRDGERIYVIDRSYNDSENHHVLVYDKDGNKIQVIGSRGNGDGQFNIPIQGAVAPDGTLYILDSGNFRVQAFDKDGKFLRSFGNPGKEFGNFGRPRGIAVDDDGLIYVTDASFNNFQIFNPEAQLLLAIGQSSLESHPGEYGMLNGIAVDETGRVYVADQLYNKVEVIRRLTDEEGEQMLKEAQQKEHAK